MQAIVIMAHFHTLASFVFGCGFNCSDLQWSVKATELNYNSNNISDLLLFSTHISSAPPSPPSPSSVNLNCLLNLNNESNLSEQQTTDSTIESNLTSSSDQTEANNAKAINNVQSTINSNNNQLTNQQQAANSLEILMRKMQNISEQKQQFELDNQEELVKNQSLEIHLTPTQTLNTEFSFNSSNSPTSLSANNGQFENSNSNSANASPNQLNQLTSKCLGNDDEQSELNKFVLDSKFCYVDFARSRARTDVQTFRVQDYSWCDHAYSLVNRLYSDVGNMLDEKFTTTYNLTYYTYVHFFLRI